MADSAPTAFAQTALPGTTPDVSLIKTLLERAAERPDAVYMLDVDGRQLTYAETVEDARRWAAAYRRLGVQPGDHVVTMQHNTIDAVLGWLGLAWMGAVEAPINNDYRGQLLIHALNLTRAPFMLVKAEFLPRVIEVAAQLQYLKSVVVVDGEAPADLPFRTVSRREFLAGAEPAHDLETPKPWDIMAVLFTSGTTGPSKAVRLPWAQIHAMTTGSYVVEDLGPDDVIYTPGPTYHVGGKTFPYLAALCGGRHVMRPFISRTAQPEEYKKFGITTGAVVHAWMDEPERPDDAQVPLRNLLTPYRDPTSEPFAKRFGARRFGCFNMTEVSCPITFRTWEDVVYDEAGRMSCGVVRPGYEARVVDENDQPVPPNTPGELILRADTPWVLNAGYLNNPEATAEAWRNGWFHTGDAVQYDENGRFYFLDRLKDCIRRNNENISSFEVEAYVMDHPAVARAAAVAVKRSQQAGANEEIKIVVERVPGAELDAETLIRWLIPRAPRFMIPRYVEFMDALPLTPTQKVQKKLLRETGVGPDTWDREKAGIALPR
jgi:crotonobetaine/carnitine-CoA ligase